MQCVLCGWPTGEPKDSYGFTMPNTRGKGRVRVHKTCLRNCGRTRAERYARVVKVYTALQTAAGAV